MDLVRAQGTVHDDIGISENRPDAFTADEMADLAHDESERFSWGNCKLQSLQY